MKKLSLLALLGTSLILVGCGNTDTPTEPTGNTTSPSEVVAGTFAAPICDEYFRVLDCTLQSQVPAEQQAEIKTVVDQTKEARQALDAATQESTCQAAWDNEILPQSDLYNQFGCNVFLDETTPDGTVIVDVTSPSDATAPEDTPDTTPEVVEETLTVVE
ncbi:hypothetical protein AGMMS50249_3980 [candidate division SR1 bacterium]|nr:hypothetical protein AGMMS50249_3980 [candidate division SR1 bacterium]